jgi:hypothetical protein
MSADQYNLMMIYMRGWFCSAAVQPTPAGMQNDEDFMAGWNDGREARRRATKDAEIKYGAKFALVKAQTGLDASSM